LGLMSSTFSHASWSFEIELPLVALLDVNLTGTL